MCIHFQPSKDSESGHEQHELGISHSPIEKCGDSIPDHVKLFTFLWRILLSLAHVSNQCKKVSLGTIVRKQYCSL